LEDEEARALAAAFGHSRIVEARRAIVREEDPPGGIVFLLEGQAVRHKFLESGRRQILSVMIPGDACDLGVALLEARDHSISTLGECVVSQVTDASLVQLSARYPKVRAALRWATLVEESIAREWLLNVGQRQAPSAMAHLFCEMYYRLRAIGQTQDLSFELAMTQGELGEAVAISTVHVNRCLQELRARKLLSFADKRVTILDLQKLEVFGEFVRTYLHLESRYSAVVPAL
jgi:CRP-like cAMP-binding protein